MPETMHLDLDALELQASGLIGWDNLTECWPAENKWDWEVGHRSESGNTYPVLTISTADYGAPYDTEKMARYHAALRPSVVLSLIQEIKASRKFGPAEVKRDHNGWWWHQGIPDFGGTEDPAPYHAWLTEQGLELREWGMERDLDVHPHFDGTVGCEGCVGWDPQSPGPEWFLLGIFDTEDGPHVHWARRAVTA